jgi:hypothetical protein
LKARAAKAAAEPGVQQPHSPQSYMSSRSSLQQDGEIKKKIKKKKKKLYVGSQ